MKNLKVKHIVILLVFSIQLSAQNSCSEEYDKIRDLRLESHSIINDKSMSISKRIRESKKLAKESLKLAYKTIGENDCKEYSFIVDRIIDLELQLGNIEKAETIALKRLNKRTPKWDTKQERAKVADLAILATISSYKGSSSFYTNIKKSKGFVEVCGTTSYEQKVSNLLWKAETIFNNYGENFCRKFLQGSTIIINEDSEIAKLIWDKVYNLIIKSLGMNASYDEIKKEFESAEIQRESKIWGSEFEKSEYFLEFAGFRIFFKTTSCPNEQNENIRCQPENLETLRIESELYKKIKEYAIKR
jgi:hypothetical protein